MKKTLSFISVLCLTSVLFAQNINSSTQTTTTNTTNTTNATKTTTTTTTTSQSESDISADDLLKSVQIAMSNPDYMVTAGDIYNLSYAAGSSTVNYNIAVDSSYKVRISNLAVLDAKGKTFMELKSSVETIVSKNYPMSGVQFVLNSPSTFKVVVTGEIEKTREANAWSLTRVSTFLNSTGLTDNASMRFITITDTNGKSVTYDLFMAERFGDMSQNPYVRPGDVVTIERIDRSVTLSGAVERQGVYELKEGENLKDLVEFYGHGLTPLADTSRIQIQRSLKVPSKYGQNYYVTSVELKSDYELNNKDKVLITSFEELSPVAFFEGAVMKNVEEAESAPNTASRIPVKVSKDTNLSFLIRENSEYFKNPEADLQNSYLMRGESIYAIDVYRVLYDQDFYSDLTVEPGDVLVVPFRQFFVTVAGSVGAAGRFPYIPNRKYDYYVGLAGGFNGNNMFKSVRIVDAYGNHLKKGDVITPECTITAVTNSPIYYIVQFASVASTILSIITIYFSFRNLFPAG